MPWKVMQSDRCPADRPWAVINQNSNAVEGCHTSKAKGLKQAAALYANEGAMRQMAMHMESNHPDCQGFAVVNSDGTMESCHKTKAAAQAHMDQMMGKSRTPSNDREVRTFPFEIEEVRAAENGRSQDFTIKGHAAVFNTWTDLGIFREKVSKKAFDEVLSKDPHVLHLIDHDTRYVLSSTRNKTLELRTDPKGLHMWSKVAPTSYAADLRVLMERGDVSQSSFAFTVAEDKWDDKTEDGVPERTILRVGELFDVTTTAMGAYATTDSQVAMRTLERARALVEELPESHPEEDPEAADPEEDAGDGTEEPLEEEASSEATAAELEAARGGADLFALKRATKSRIAEAKAAKEQLERQMRWK